MARKAVDLFSLLASRGGPRSSQRRSGGFLSGLGAVLGSLFSRSHLRSERRRPLQLSRMGVASIVLACVVAGYLLGDSFPLRRAGTALDSRSQEPKGKAEGQRPGPISDGLDAFRLPADRESELLSNQAFFAVVYRDDEREKAADLALQL